MISKGWPRLRTHFSERLGSHSAKAGATLMGGTAIAQLITLAMTPILARLYSPEDFGYLALISACAAIIVPLAGLRLESALLLTEKDRGATALLVTSLCSALIISIFYILSMEVVFKLGYFGDMQSMPFFSLWTGSIAFLTATFTSLSQFALRARQYRLIARRNVHQSLGAGIGQLVAFPFLGSSTGLIAGHAIGRAAGILPLYLEIRKQFRRFRLRDVSSNLKEYWRFPLIFAPSALFNSLGIVLPILFVGIHFSVAQAGAWGMAERMMAVPMVLLGTAGGQVVEAELAKRMREKSGSIRSYYLKFSALLGVVAGAFSLAVLLSVDILIRLFLGPGWDLAGSLIKIMVIMVSVRLVALPMAKALIVMQKALLTLLLDLLRVVLIILALVVVVIKDLSIMPTAVLVSVAMTIVYAVTWVLGLRATRSFDQIVEQAEE